MNRLYKDNTFISEHQIFLKKTTFLMFYMLVFSLNCTESKFNTITVLRNFQTNDNITAPIMINVAYSYNYCDARMCGDNICATYPKAECQLLLNSDTNNELNNNTVLDCVCQSGFITWDDQCVFKCCYKQKNAVTAMILEFLIGFGVGHFYVGNNFIGMVKLCIYSLFCFSSLGIAIKLFITRGQDDKSFIFKVTCTICLLLCSCTYIGWQITDAILFSIGGYTDGNGASLYIP